MNVLIPVRGYYPAVKHGGPPVAIENICDATGDRVTYYILTTNHDKGDTAPLPGIAPGWNKVGKANVIYLSPERETYSEFDKITADVQPDLIYIQSLFDAGYTLPFLKIAKKRNIPALLAVRGELSKGVFTKKHKKIPYIWLMRLSGLMNNISFHATYDGEREDIRRILAKHDQPIDTISDLPTMTAFHPKENSKTAGTLKAVFISRIVENKNLLDVLKSLRQVTAEVTLDIYGFQQDGEYWKICEQAMADLPTHIHARYCGALRHEDVVDTLTGYDVMIFPTYSENYGQIIAESLLASCPVILTDRTPFTNLGNYGAGRIVELHDLPALTRAIEEFAGMDKAGYGEILDNVKTYVDKELSIEEKAERYTAMFRQAGAN